jgi:hypothetical protein
MLNVVTAGLAFTAPLASRLVVTPRVGGFLMQEDATEAPAVEAPAVEEEAAPLPPPPAAPKAAKVMSKAMPFMEQPPNLDGTMAGDVGFDPFGFSNHEVGPFDTAAEHMAWMREAELKHGPRNPLV